MRKLGIGTLGAIGGVLLALIVQDLFGRVFLDAGPASVGLAIVIGLLIPVFAVLGSIAAVLIDVRAGHRQWEKAADKRDERHPAPPR